jgi:glycosyltransferase involved in cell wall biosynthesis
MVSKALVVGAYQRKLEEIAAHPGIALTAVVPPAWRDARGLLCLERAHAEGYTLRVEPIRFNGSFHLHYYPGLARCLAEVRPDILHVDEEPYNFAAYHALRLARRVGARALFFSWQNIARRYPPPFSWMERWVLDHVHYGMVGNQEAVEVWRGKRYAGPLTVIPQFGVDPGIFSPAPTPRRDEVFNVGYAGRLVGEKGLDVLIRALARTPGRTHLTLAGDGPLRDELSRLAGLHNIGGSVSLVGPLPSTAMPDFYRRLDALVLPSRTRPNWKEQFGRALIEAMACGVPVIGSDCGAIPEVIGDAGIVVPEGDVEALRAALASLAGHPRLRQQLAEAGRRRVLERYTQAHIAAQTVAVYREMARGAVVGE